MSNKYLLKMDADRAESFMQDVNSNKLVAIKKVGTKNGKTVIQIRFVDEDTKGREFEPESLGF